MRKQPRTTIEFLDALRNRYECSDYALREKIGVTQTAISSYRTGKTHFDDAVSLKVAELLDLEPGYVLSCIHAERTKRPEVKAVWEKMAKSLAAGIAALMVSTTPTQTNASPAPSGDGASSVYYVKRRRNRPKDTAPAFAHGIAFA